ncbi:MAG: hypothetical protein J7K21_02290 [Desulfurococcales archaeon]|nr:hypothetical protein [Desulfurococcales archaeon]
MIIHGVYDRVRKYFFILARIRIHDRWYGVNFMFDTGASVTALLDRDAIRILGDKLGKLKKARKDLVGIGGFADTYIVRNVELELIDAYKLGNTYRAVLEKLYVVTHHKRFRGDEWKRVSQLPSIIGRDILFKARKIIIDLEKYPPQLQIIF